MRPIAAALTALLLAFASPALAELKAPPTPRAVVADLGQALGWTYVIEGSALGGRVMLKRMTAAGVDLTGLGHLNIHGDQTGARWRTVLAALDAAEGVGVDRAAIVRGACDAFAYAHRILAPAASEIAA